jgi:hypothetical protein
VADAVYNRAVLGRPGRDVRNATDAVFRNGGRRSLLRLRRSGSGYLATIRIGVQRS